MVNRTHKSVWLAVIPALCIALLIAGQSTAGSVSMPNTFAPGTLASAAEVNANFDALSTAVNDNDNRLTDVETLASSVASLRPRFAIKVDASGNVGSYESVAGIVPVVTRPNPGVYEIDITGVTVLERAQFLANAYLQATLTHGFGLSRTLELQINTLASGNEGIIVQVFASTNAGLVNHGFTLVAIR